VQSQHIVKNRILGQLSADELKSVQPWLTLQELRSNVVLHERGDSVERVYFPLNWRRLMSSMGSPSEPAVPAYCRISMHRKRPQVLGIDLNLSESGRQVLFTLLRASFRRCCHRASGRTAAQPRSWVTAGPAAGALSRRKRRQRNCSPAPENFFQKRFPSERLPPF
jgi:hypothetical protein